jgi:hypothetical protein
LEGVGDFAWLWINLQKKKKPICFGTVGLLILEII